VKENLDGFLSRTLFPFKESLQAGKACLRELLKEKISERTLGEYTYISEITKDLEEDF